MAQMLKFTTPKRLKRLDLTNLLIIVCGFFLVDLHGDFKQYAKRVEINTQRIILLEQEKRGKSEASNDFNDFYNGSAFGFGANRFGPNFGFVGNFGNGFAYSGRDL